MVRIDEIHTKYPYMGQQKIVKLLKVGGFEAGKKLFRSYMREMAIYPIYPKPNLSKRNFKEAVVPYLLRNMNTFMSNQVWSVDITFIKMQHRHMYLTAIIDWYSRKIVGWNLSDTLDTEYVIEVMQGTVAKHGWKKRWAVNIMIERWFRSLKNEKIYIEEFCSPKELRAGIRQYINEYNTVRPHKSHDYAKPDAMYYGMFQLGLSAAA